MENLLLSFEVVFPLFLMMTLGYLLKYFHIVDDHTARQVNNCVFRLFLPLLVFSNIYHTNLETAFRPKLILFGVGAVLSAFLITLFLIFFIEKDNSRRGVLLQGIFRSNYIIFGVPVTVSLYGDESGGLASMLAAFIIPLFNVLAVIALEIFKNAKIDVKKILKGVITNPLIIASLAAAILLLTGLKMPMLLDDVLTDIASIATPLALIILGASFTFSAVHGRMKQILIGVSGRLIFVPLKRNTILSNCLIAKFPVS